MTNCVCYVVDDNYLFPTLVSAIQAKEHVDACDVDVRIFCISNNPKYSSKFSAVASTYDVHLTVVPTKVIENMHPMFGRLFLHRMLSESYERVIYIDGDTQIKGSIMPLIDVTIVSGNFLAVRDPDVLFASRSKKGIARMHAFREKIGIKNHNNYFNSGVLAFNARDWAEISKLALATVEKSSLKLEFPDQDALNISVGDRCTYIPNRWNFPGFVIGSEMDTRVKPVIYHFMSNPRPWTHKVPPWGASWQAPYRKILVLHPELNEYKLHATKSARLRYWLQQHLKMFSEYGPVGRTREAEADLII